MDEIISAGESPVMGDFQAPANYTVIDQLFGQYASERERIAQVANTMASSIGDVFGYFVTANADERSRWHMSVQNIFKEDGAVKALDAHYWNKALNMTDVLSCMPEKVRAKWFEQIEKLQCAPFERETVLATITEQLKNRARYMAERVDGLFQALSREHVTNRPEGFSKRMIIYYFNGGHINDLRAVIAKITGRDEPHYRATAQAIDVLKNRTGEWVTLDGGALRIRLYMKGTAHLEVHEDIAWRLNQILAYLHPAAIPAEFRTQPKPKRKAKPVDLLRRPLPFAVLGVLTEYGKCFDYVPDDSPNSRYGQRAVLVPNAVYRSARRDGDVSQANAIREAHDVLRALGGVRRKNGDDEWQFDYPPDDVLSEIITSGCIPDARSHQYYPTPQHMAQQAIELADIGEHDLNLEPSAGTGGLADFMPKERTVCVEVSQLHCEVLRAKGHNVEKADFLEWAVMARARGQRFTRIIMNPPFADGRWKDHLRAALSMLDLSGVLVAILPDGANTATVKQLVDEAAWMDDCAIDWHGPFDYPGVSIKVRIMRLQREHLPF